MFEITEDQLGQLGASDLRELVARLCTAELTSRGAPASAVKWDGAHTAPDGGLDVDCDVKDQPYEGDFVPRARTGIQVKRSTMPPSKIPGEMSPDTTLRPVFSELAAAEGCYVIVSLADDPAGTWLGKRTRSMRAQVLSLPNHNDLRLEFYGRGHLANWLRNHPAVQLWARSKLGIATSGWKPFGRWATTPNTVSDELICEPGVVISIPGTGQRNLGIGEGIEEIRQLVRSSNKAVRIVGLSGVGKTRIVQALFEDSIGTTPLDPNLAIYADLGATPSPSAREVMDQLVLEGRPAVLVLDNCPSTTHSQLAPLVAESATLNLITVEYDVREDRPESTDVVRIDAEGTGVASALVKRRYPALSQVNAERIAQFSDGNARLALVLADAVEESESLSDFSNAQLFERLFYQAGAPDIRLREAAEVLSLVYSFSTRRDVDGVDELSVLAELIGHTRLSLYRSAQVLFDRQLLQERTHWRAVLPQALSDRLAAKALESTPREDILAAFECLPSPRLLISFGKRLGNLHDHRIAREIVKRWMAPGGRLYDFGNLQEQEIKLLQNIAPVAPEQLLAGMEREARKPTSGAFFSGKNPHHWVFTSLLTSIAYETGFFERCVALLAQFASSDEGADRHIRDRLFSLFTLYLSGTQAGPHQRERVLRRFLFNQDPAEQKLGLGMLEAAIKSSHWSSIQSFEFGARPRSFGYRPKTGTELDAWFERFITLARDAAVGTDVAPSRASHELLANNFRGLWELPGLREKLTDLAMALNEHRPWLQGWRAIRSIRYLDYSDDEAKGGTECLRLLESLDEELRPERLADQIRAYVLAAGAQVFSLEDEFDPRDSGSWQDSTRIADEKARDLGKTAAHELGVLEELSMELFAAPLAASPRYLTEFGRGLAQESGDLEALWNKLVDWYERAADKFTHFAVLTGPLLEIHERDSQAAWNILDKAVEQKSLRRIIVGLHESIPLGPEGGARLIRALDHEDVTAPQFEATIWRPGFDSLSEDERLTIMRKLMDKPGGAEIVLDGLSMSLHRFKQAQQTLSAEIRTVALSAATSLLRNRPTIGYSPMIGHHLSRVLDKCMHEDEFPAETQTVVDAVFFRWNNSYGMFGGIDDAVSVVAERSPIAFLDGLFFSPGVKEHHRYHVFRERRHARNPLSNVPVKTLLRWCELGDFQERLMLIADLIFPFAEDTASDKIVLSEQARGLIDATDNPNALLDVLSRCIEPSVISGSLANLIATRADALRTLLTHERADICAAANQVLIQMREWENEARQREVEKDRTSQHTFE